MSTSTSEALLTAEKLNLVVHADVHRPWTWRETFTRFSSDPIGMLLGEKDRLHIVKNVTFKIRQGERIGLIGVNGSGKTSLCRVLSNMYQPTSGKVSTDGVLRAIFDTSIGILPELTGRENAELLARFMYPNDNDIDSIVQNALEFSELGKFIDVPYKLYSKGMQARLCLSLISARPCNILILDEVFDGADKFFSEKIAARVLSIIKRSGAVVFVSHSPDQIRTVCNRVMVMHQGEIAFDGKVDEGLAFFDQLGGKRDSKNG